MQYELLNNSYKGVIVDNTPILRDIRDTFEVSFLVEDNKSLIAVFKDEKGVAHRCAIIKGKCRFPREILMQGKNQYIDVTVFELKENEVCHTWTCEPIKVNSFLGLTRNQFQLSSGVSDTDWFNRVVELNKKYDVLVDEMKTLKDNVSIRDSQIKEQGKIITELVEKQNKMADLYEQLKEEM